MPLEYGQHGDVLGRRRSATSGTGPVRGEQLLHAAVALDLVAGPHRPVAGRLGGHRQQRADGDHERALLSSSWLAMSFAVVSADSVVTVAPARLAA